MALFFTKNKGVPIETETPFLLVGLGNPGPEYERTRHNIGFQVVDTLLEEGLPNCSFSAFKKNFKGVSSEGMFQRQKIFLLKPLTYMNLSGDSVGAMMRFYKIPLDHILVIHDDLDLPLGTVRFKNDGGNGGHNGLKSITDHIGNAYWRLRIGIGHPGAREKVTPYVLSPFTKEEDIVVSAVCERFSEFLPLFLEGKRDVFNQTFQESLKPYQSLK